MVFRYGWFSKAEIESATAQALSCTNVNEARKQTAESKNPSRSSDHRTVSAEPIITPTPSSASTPIITVACDIPVSNVNTSRYPDSTAVVSSLPGKESGDLTYTRQVENTVCLHLLPFIALDLDASSRSEFHNSGIYFPRRRTCPCLLGNGLIVLRI